MSPLRIGCKVSVMVTRSGVVLDNVSRWKWVKEIGNHQYAPCVNWRRSWFMAPSYSVHTCWIYSFFFFPPSLSPGSRTGKGAFLRSSSPPRCSLWHSVMDSPETGQCIYKMNRAPSIGWRRDWKTLPPACRECREETNYQICTNWCTALPVAVLTHLPLSVFHHLISHVCLSVSSYLQTQTERGQLWLFLRPRNSCNPRMALHLFKSCSG